MSLVADSRSRLPPVSRKRASFLTALRVRTRPVRKDAFGKLAGLAAHYRAAQRSGCPHPTPTRTTGEGTRSLHWPLGRRDVPDRRTSRPRTAARQKNRPSLDFGWTVESDRYWVRFAALLSH